jgi:hypothetical protein
VAEVAAGVVLQQHPTYPGQGGGTLGDAGGGAVHEREELEIEDDRVIHIFFFDRWMDNIGLTSRGQKLRVFGETPFFI